MSCTEKGEIAYFELRVEYTDEDGLESTEWIDPILQIIPTAEALVVHNGNYTYEYPWHTVKNWEVTPVYKYEGIKYD